MLSEVSNTKSCETFINFPSLGFCFHDLEACVKHIQSDLTGRDRNVKMSTDSAREKRRQMVPRHFDSCSSVGFSCEMFGLFTTV
jgi:hypothetical protein